MSIVDRTEVYETKIVDKIADVNGSIKQTMEKET